MSSSYVSIPPLPFLKLKRMRCPGIKQDRSQSKPLTLCLTDGTNFLWAHCKGNGFTTFARYAGSDEEAMFSILQERFGVRFVNDADDEDFDAAYEATAQANDAEGRRYYSVEFARQTLADKRNRPAMIRIIAEALLQGEGVASPMMEVLRADKRAVRELGQAIADLADQPAKQAKPKRTRKGKPAS